MNGKQNFAISAMTGTPFDKEGILPVSYVTCECCETEYDEYDFDCCPECREPGRSEDEYLEAKRDGRLRMFKTS